MSFRTDDRDLVAQRPQQSATPSSSSRAAAPARLPDDAGDDDVRARGPAPQQQPSDEYLVVDSPPLHDDQPDRDGHSGDEPHTGLLRRGPIAVALGLALSVVVAAAGYLYWDNAGRFETTDDAFVAARQFAIAPKVSGYITAVPVTDNQQVAAGDVIARIDDRDYRTALDQAKAQLAHDQAALDQAQKNLGRYQTLAKTDSIAQQQVDDQGFLVEQDQSTVALDQAKVDAAQLDLSHTTISAAEPGHVVSLTAAVGQFAQAGTTVTMFVPDEIWVTANFKETQLDAMRPEQPVTLVVDAYPNRTIGGHIASVQPGSGTAFSLLPPENATGNWVKIVQRVPVKIVMDDPPTDVALGPGMSVEATVRVNPKSSLFEQMRAWL
jgi:membrane fusion protein (multidrug efflux system)